MPRLVICSRDLHWQWINRALLCDTMEVSMLRLAWLTIARHVFQPALTDRLELISRKIVSFEQCWTWTNAITVIRFCEKLPPVNWVQGVTAISWKKSRSLVLCTHHITSGIWWKIQRVFANKYSYSCLIIRIRIHIRYCLYSWHP